MKLTIFNFIFFSQTHHYNFILKKYNLLWVKEMGFFRRIEEKYVLTENQYNQIIKDIETHFVMDVHGISTICNIYFDTEKNDLIINSLEKPLYKEKVRLRSYGIPNLDSNVFLEIKKKYKGVVSKRRISMKLSEFYRYYNNNVKPFDNQIMREIDYCFKYYDLKPKLFLAYDRIAYYEKNNDDFRLTFDFNIRSRKENLYLEKKSLNKNLFDYKYYIMEVKTLGAMPLWFTDILSSLKIYPVSFSKYGEIYQKESLNV